MCIRDRFYDSQADWERRHLADAFAFELSKVTVAAIRQRMVASLRNVSDDLARTCLLYTSVF